MPTVTLNKDVFEKLVGKKIPLEQLKDRISMLGTDLEKIEGNEIHVEVFPNRPDMLSEQGFARAFSAFIAVKKGLRQYKVKKSGKKVKVDTSVTMRPYAACAIVKNLTFNDESIREIMQIQEKLTTTHGRNRKKSCYGLYPLTAIKFPINYTAKELKSIKFRPLGFDAEMTGAEIEEKHPTGVKYSHLAKGWKKYPCYVDSKGSILSMLPYTNSNDTGRIDVDTKEVFIECTGTDLNNVKSALNIIVTMLADMGGQIYSMEIEYPDRTIITPDLTPEKMKLDLNYVNKRLGLELNEQQAKKLIELMGYGYSKGTVFIPAYRVDILHQIDLVEDIAIAYGYENFKEEIPNISTIGAESKHEILAKKLREILIGLKLIEVKNYHLMTAEELNDKMALDNPLITLKNAKGEHNCLRSSILPSLLKTLAANQHNEYPQNIFELGKVFGYGNTETGVNEKEKLAVALCHEKADFTEIKQVLDAFFASLGKKCTVKEFSHPSFIKGRVGEIIVDGKPVGIIGELKPQVLSSWGLVMPAVVFEIDE